MKKTEKKNVLVLGASGNVAGAFLRMLPHARHFVGSLILMDKDDRVLKNPYINHEDLRYTFVKQSISVPQGEATYHETLKKYDIHAVIDLTDTDSIPLLLATDRAGVAYMNTAINGVGETTDKLISRIFDSRESIKAATHILCCGMNPGNVNIWVEHGIEQYGVPENITHFEYDTSVPARGWEPMITWSKDKYLAEAIIDSSGVVLGKNKVTPLLPNALMHERDMTSILSPIIKLEHYPHGFTILHEENVTIGFMHDVPSEFIYAVHMKTIRYLEEQYKKGANISSADLLLGNNTTVSLDGADLVGVILSYPDKKVYYYNILQNRSIIGSNATCWQVAIGVMSAMLTWVAGECAPGVYFTSDLYRTDFKNYLFDNMQVEHKVFKKREGELELVHYVPALKSNMPDGKHIFFAEAACS